MNLFELISFGLVIWLTAWIANLIAQSLEVPLFVSAGITAFGVILVITFVSVCQKRLKTNRGDDNTQD